MQRLISSSCWRTYNISRLWIVWKALHTKKIGLFGQLLTSGFDVNYEIYSEIDTSNYQTKLFITTLYKVNETEKLIANQKERFKSKLNKGLKVMNAVPIPFPFLSVLCNLMPASSYSCFYVVLPPFLWNSSTALMCSWSLVIDVTCPSRLRRLLVVLHILPSSAPFVQFFSFHLPPSIFFLCFHVLFLDTISQHHSFNDSFSYSQSVGRYFYECHSFYSARHNW